MGIEVQSGPWPAHAVEQWLVDTAIPVRLATSGRSGPIVQSLWFSFDEAALWCATQRDSAVANRIRRDPVVGWEVAPDQPPYRGVRGRGTAEVLDDPARAEAVLRVLIHRYGQSGTALEGWLLGRVSTEVAIRITDLTVTSWDYSPRM